MDTGIDTDRLIEKDREVENFDAHIPDPPTLTLLTANHGHENGPYGYLLERIRLVPFRSTSRDLPLIIRSCLRMRTCNLNSCLSATSISLA